MGKKRTQAYAEEFRREAVKRAEKPGVTTASVARELSVSARQIYN
ncbi:transposase [Microbulbifer sp. EKSA005]